MLRPDESTSCPLCFGDHTIPTARVPTAPIIAYWQSIGYDIGAAFPELPEYLTKVHCTRCDLRYFLPRMIGGPDLYATLQRTGIYYGATKWEFAEALRLLAATNSIKSLLEFGCGRGEFLEQAKRQFEKVRGIDFNAEAILQCCGKGLDVSDAVLFEIDVTYDAVVSFQALEHLADPGEVFAQLAGLVRPGGCLLVAVPNEDGPLGELQQNYLNLPPHHFSRWTERTMRFLAGVHGLQVETYCCEPLSEMLYLTLINERLDRHLTAKSLPGRLINALARRIAIALTLTQMDVVRDRLAGHTQIAVYRKLTSPSSS